jgi:putative oxidoreductase
VRIVVALLFFEHCLSKMFGFPQPVPPPALFSLSWFSCAIEFVGGGLLVIGLFSRASAFIMSGEMAIGYFISHAPHSFFPILNRGDAAILYCFIFLLLVDGFPNVSASCRSWLLPMLQFSDHGKSHSERKRSLRSRLRYRCRDPGCSGRKGRGCRACH